VVFAKTRRLSAEKAFPCRKARRRGGPLGAHAAAAPTATILILPGAEMRGGAGVCVSTLASP
jgi:hypothetical protein